MHRASRREPSVARRARRRAWGVFLPALSAATLCAASAVGGDALNSSDQPRKDTDAQKPGAHNEFNIVPAAGGTTDIGIGGGYFIGLTRTAPGVVPYVWDLESAGFITFAHASGDGFEVPYQDLYVDFTVPRFLGSPMWLEVRPEYSWETTLNYNGLGNASTAVPPQGAQAKYFMYGRLHPYLPVDLRWRILDHLAGHAGMTFEQSWLQVAKTSKLALDQTTGTPEVKKLIGSFAPQGVATLIYGAQWDNRDSEVSTHRGMFHTIDVKLSPGDASMPELRYRYAEFTANARAFVPIWGDRIVLAVRVVGDALLGSPPFYELSRFNDGFQTYAIGGLYGVRGVPAQRYYGKLKVFENAEVRTELASFHALGHKVVFGVTGFFDGGRVWADTTAQPDLDGRGLGFKYGVGGGVRFQSGSTFVLRADIAYSPDATPVGGYVAAGQMF
jgi:outer membrane protein assembly factor BamA